MRRRHRRRNFFPVVYSYNYPYYGYPYNPYGYDPYLYSEAVTPKFSTESETEQDSIIPGSLNINWSTVAITLLLGMLLFK